jgi:hypothetical protein
MADKVLLKEPSFEVYTDGHVGAFLSYVRGDGFPQSTTYVDANGNQNILHDPKGGGWPDLVSVEQQPVGSDPSVLNQGTIESLRVRSGTSANALGLGVRSHFAEGYTASAYLQVWTWIENVQRITGQPNYADVRQGYGKIESPYGSLLAGRMFGLFSRAATEIDLEYAHRWGLGFPGGDNIDSAGFVNGQIGFGLLGNGEGAAIAYASPVLEGLALSVGLYDPLQLQGPGAWVRTKWGRPEGELTFERPIGDVGRYVLFTSGTYEEVYKQGYCVHDATHPFPCAQPAGGVVYGGRFEYGPFHLGASAYYGRGLGLNYALEVNDASVDPQGNTRWSDGYYVQTQVALRPFDVFAGAGIARLFLNAADYARVQDPRTPNDPSKTIDPHSWLKYQLGINAGVVYHLAPFLHYDLDFFRAEAAWRQGEKQVLYVLNSGLSYNW